LHLSDFEAERLAATIAIMVRVAVPRS